MEPKYIPLREVAESNGLSFRALSDAARAGKIQTRKPSRSRLTTAEWFEEYMQAHRPQPAPAKAKETDGTEKFLQAQARRRLRAAQKRDTR